MKNIYSTKLICYAIAFLSMIHLQISFAQDQRSVSEILDENGKIKSNTDGSYNASGYKLEYGKNKEPIFKKTNSLNKTTTITWSALGECIGPVSSSYVEAIAISGSNVYVGGQFTYAGGNSANYIAKWDGSNWSPLIYNEINGVNAKVNAIAISGTDVYIGGEFTTVGGTAANYIAKWDGTTWSTLGTGLNDIVNAITISGNDLYVGGKFTTAGGGSANHIAKWNISSSEWTSLGDGVNGWIYAIAISGSNIYVGGVFYTAGSIDANNIALWNGSWNALGSDANNGLNNTVRTITINETDIYVGGTFTRIGPSSTSGTVADYIAKWNTSTNEWSGLASGMNNYVRTIVISGSYIYAGGYFSQVGGVNDVKCLAKLQGSTWTPFTTGPDGGVHIMAVNSSVSTMIVGGVFTNAGGILNTRRIAQFTDSDNPALPVELQNFSAVYKFNQVELNWNTATEVNTYGFEIERTIQNLEFRTQNSKWEMIGFVDGSGNSNSKKDYNFTDEKPLIGNSRYRLKQIDNDGQFKYSDEVEVEVKNIPSEFLLAQNFPNPFNPETKISFSIPQRSYVNLKIYNSLGQEVQQLYDGIKEVGSYDLSFSAKDLPSGLYFYTLRVKESESNKEFSETKKMILLR